MKRNPLAALVAAVLVTAVPASAELMVYPAKGQSKDQQAKDEAACSQWATEQAGDPAKAAAPAAPPPQQKGGRARGAATGAVIAGASGGDKSDAAVAGAVVGASRDRRKNAAAQQQAQAASSQQQAAAQGTHEKAQAACLEGKGYTVK